LVWIDLRVLELGFKIFISYLAGSLNGALIVGRLFGGVDIREHGSGNAGGTNALRTQGKLFAILVMAIDIGKGILPVLFLPFLAFPTGLDDSISRSWLTFACGGAAIFGHCYPVWHQFKGGKGAATTLGVLAAVAPVTILPATIVWFATLFTVGYVGLATILAAVSIPTYLALTDFSNQRDLFLFTSIVAVFVVYTHRSNLQKLLRGESTPDIRFRLLGRSG
jgi:glycerol-3-phosphate acyltransferase PlsY